VPAIRGEKISCLGLTEPDAGSDVAGIKTRAVRDGGDWVINGSKTYITNGDRADFIVLVASAQAVFRPDPAVRRRATRVRPPDRRIPGDPAQVRDMATKIEAGVVEYGIEPVWRDLQLNRIGAGTDEIVLDLIGRSHGL
jgi:alkylation response protein AidB-like acyl-CoA dehydrogenase